MCLSSSGCSDAANTTRCYRSAEFVIVSGTWFSGLTVPFPQVPGTYFDAMNSQTKLGKAVRAAVEELEHLGDLVRNHSS
jgi:hypothetical protein